MYMHLFLSTNEQFYCTLLDTRAGLLPLLDPNHKCGPVVPCLTQATRVGLSSLAQPKPQGWSYCPLLNPGHKGGVIVPCSTQATRVGLSSLAQPKPQGWSYCPLLNPGHKGGVIVPCSTQATRVGLLSLARPKPHWLRYVHLLDLSYKNVHLHDSVHNHRLLSAVSLNSQGRGY